MIVKCDAKLCSWLIEGLCQRKEIGVDILNAPFDKVSYNQCMNYSVKHIKGHLDWSRFPKR